MNGNIVELTISHEQLIAPLIAAFRVHLRTLKNHFVEPDLEEGCAEFKAFLADDFPIYGIFVDDTLAGYLVCKVEGTLVWVEQIFVAETYRHQGLASQLFQKAEDLSTSLGGETLFNYVHPNNHVMLAFLRKQGYTVLNLIEVRKPFEDEVLTRKIKVNDESFDY